jgi:hypothetical protein
MVSDIRQERAAGGQVSLIAVYQPSVNPIEPSTLEEVIHDSERH